MIAETLQRRNFGDAAAHVLALAERTAITALNAEGEAGRKPEALQALFDIARNAVARGAITPKSDGAGAKGVEYEGGAALESFRSSRGLKGRLAIIARKCVNNRQFARAA